MRQLGTVWSLDIITKKFWLFTDVKKQCRFASNKWGNIDKITEIIWWSHQQQESSKNALTKAGKVGSAVVRFIYCMPN